MAGVFKGFLLVVGLTLVYFSFPVLAEAASTDLTKTDFKIDLKTITPGSDRLAEGGVAGARGMANAVLGAVIRILLIAMGSIGLLTMSIGAGYMIVHMGHEESLSKGKSIFMSGLFAIAIALSSYLIIAFVRYILYSDLITGRSIF